MIWKRCVTVLTVSFICLFFVNMGFTKVVKAIECQKELLNYDNVEYGYKKRENRCEGLYSNPVSYGYDIRVVSFSIKQPETKLDGKKTFRWYLPNDSTFSKLILNSYLRNIPYRMDTEVLNAEDNFVWMASIPPNIGLMTDDGIGRLVFSETNLCPGTDMVLVPVEWDEWGKNKKWEYKIGFVSSLLNVEEYYVTLEYVNKSNNEVVLRDQKLENGPYYPNSLTHFVLTGLKKTGCYRLTIGARLESSIMPLVSTSTRSNMYYRRTEQPEVRYIYIPRI